MGGESILNEIKKALPGIDPSDTAFDDELIMWINTIFFKMNELGIGPDTPFYISDATSKWTDFDADITKMLAVKGYMVAEARLAFDPPSNATHKSAIEHIRDEYEWRLINKG